MLLESNYVDDPNYAQGAEAVQATPREGNRSEQWADAFANYVAGNIDTNEPTGGGRNMYNFVTGALAPFISDPTKYGASVQ